MIDELHVLDIILAVFIVTCTVIGLAIYTRPQQPPVSKWTRHRINQQHDQEK